MHLYDRVIQKADQDEEFRARLLSNPKRTLQEEYGINLLVSHELCVHSETDTLTHLVLPPKSKFSDAEKEAARAGATSLEFLKETMYDPAPPKQDIVTEISSIKLTSQSPQELVDLGQSCIQRGLEFLDSTLDDNGAWHCIRFNLGDSNIPRHYERPPFISAFCALALQASDNPLAKKIIRKTTQYLVETIEYPGLWRYYRHLPLDLDSSSLGSLMLGSHPWICFGRNRVRMLANRDEQGRFMTWLLDEGEPDVVSQFRIEADPVVNANIIAYLGDCDATRPAQNWLRQLIEENIVKGTSKWYPDEVSIYYAVSKAIERVQPALDQLKPTIADRLLNLRDVQGDFGNIFCTARAVSTLYNIGWLNRIDLTKEFLRLIETQQADGSWPEVLAFGDQSRKFGIVGRIGHGSDTVTTAFCIEALERLTGCVG